MTVLRFHGAAKQVTGSMHLVEANGKTIALDCGLFQGRREESRLLNRQHPHDPKAIHAVIVSHAHVDHTGRLPLLVKDGFTGVIHATPATRDLSAIMLADSAYIQAEDARFLNKHRRRKNEPAFQPLYNDEDAVQVIRQMQSSPYNRWFKVASGIHARFFDAGHMLGSAGIELEIKGENGSRRTLVFTGDVGRPNIPILRNPAPLPPCDDLICESTYGGRRSDHVPDMKGRLADIVNRTAGRGGRVIIPAFSVGRTQTIVYFLRQLIRDSAVPHLPVYIDSPLAVNATEVFKMHPECYDREALFVASQNGGLLDGPDIHYVQSREDSKRMLRRRAPCVVIAASGMCEAGRVLHHLRHTVRDERHTILIVGFQAAHTLGRRIVEREEYVRIYGQRLKFKAEVDVLNGFSAHADSQELVSHLDPLLGRCRRVFLVHGEPDQAAILAGKLRERGHPSVIIPARGDSSTLD